MKARLSSLLIAFVTLFVLFLPTQGQAPTAGQVNDTANLRGGPGTTFPIVGSLAAATAIEIAACNDDCSWYQLPTGEWIAAFLVTPVMALPTALASVAPAAATITIVGWNVESGGALQVAVSDRLGSFQDVDIWGLSEVNAIDAEAFEFGAETGEGANYESYLGTTGAADRLLLIWNEDRFDLIGGGQLTDIGQGARAPLWVQLKEQATGLEFVVMVNHLHRSNEGTRHRQAQMLNAWAAGQTLPVIAVGDYNFDWNLPNGDTDHDAGYDNVTKDGVWKWVRPAELVTTQCSGWPCGYNSVLDFVFAAGPAREWNITSEIIVVENDFPDDLTTPDHRPVMAVIQPADAVAAPITTTIVLTPTTTPTAIPTTAPTAVPTCPQTNGTANVRSGPGTGYAVVGSLQQGECVVITGRTEVGDWFQLSNSNWIAAFLVTNPGPMSNIPVVTVAAAGAGSASVIAPPPAVEPAEAEPLPPTETPIPPTATPLPPTPVPVPATAVPQQEAQNCDSSYPTVCIPPYPPDLDCGEIPFRRFQVVGDDPHGFDGDSDGIGCES